VSRFRNFSRRAAADLDDTVGWLLDHGVAPGAAEQLLTTVLAAAERLAERPAIGRRRPDLLAGPFRFWSIPRWKLLLVYDPTTTPAKILRILNTAQDLAPLLADFQDPRDE
jgi:plasmid stabilization system protein ParE